MGRERQNEQHRFCSQRHDRFTKERNDAEMTLQDTCDIKDCELLPSKQILFKGFGLFASLNADGFDLCGKHYLELLNQIWGMSKAKVLSEKSAIRAMEPEKQ